jgi:hypothetical protein
MAFLLKRRNGRDIAKKNGTVLFKTGRIVSLPLYQHSKNKELNYYYYYY